MVGERVSLLREHPFLVVYLIALLLIWAASAATWSIRPGASPDLHPVAQGLQYLLVVLASTLAALRLRTQPVQDGATGGFRWYDYEMRISDDVGARSFWAAAWVGIVAMEANVAFLVVADLVAAGGGAGIGTYIQWVGAGLAAGFVIGMFSAFVALAAAGIWGLLRRGRRGA